jgi:hypothetical protein
MPIPKSISLALPDAIVVNAPRLLVGTWVTSFVAWYPGQAADGLLPIKVANSFVKWLTPADKFDQGLNDFLANPANEAEIEALGLIFPARVATLSYFVFAADGTFSVGEGRNLGDRYEFSPINGVFNVGWNTLGIAVGDIILEFGITLKFILLSKDEMKFIVAHGSTANDSAPVAAGTMRRVYFLKRPFSFWEEVSSFWGGVLKIIGRQRS